MDEELISFSKASLRRFYRLKRQQFSIEEQQQKSVELLNILINQPEFITADRIAAYWPNDGEIDPRPIIQTALKLGKKCYLPVLQPENNLALFFVEYQTHIPLVTNALGFKEPQWDPQGKLLEQEFRWLLPKELDLVFLPLVAFDDKGQRLGRGLGYYDRSFAFLRDMDKDKDKNEDIDKKDIKPFLIGLGFEIQYFPVLPKDEWDVKLDGVATEKRFIIYS